MLVSAVTENNSLLYFLQPIKATLFYTPCTWEHNLYSFWHYLVAKEIDSTPTQYEQATSRDGT